MSLKTARMLCIFGWYISSNGHRRGHAGCETSNLIASAFLSVQLPSPVLTRHLVRAEAKVVAHALVQATPSYLWLHPKP